MTNTEKPQRMIAVKNVVGRLGISRTTLHNMIKAGEFPRPVRVRGRVLWPEKAVDDWIETRFAEVNTAC